MQPGFLPLARMVAGILDFAERESPALFQRLGGEPRRTGGDLEGLITDLGKAIKYHDPEIRLATAHTLGHLGQAFEVYAGDATTATPAAVSALSHALTAGDAGVREAVLVALANFPTMASPALVDRVSRVRKTLTPASRWPA